MAKGHALNPGWKAGDNWDTCDRCGFERRVSALREEWNGLTVCADTCWEQRHPQDFLRAREDRVAAPQPGTQDADTVTSYTAVAGHAVTGVAIAGDGPDQSILTPVPSGTFDNGL